MAMDLVFVRRNSTSQQGENIRKSEWCDDETELMVHHAMYDPFEHTHAFIYIHTGSG